MKLFVRIAGIECQNCIDALTRALGAVEGVASVRFHGHVAELEIARTATGSPGELAPPPFSAVSANSAWKASSATSADSA